MQRNPVRLRELLDEEGEGGWDLSPAGEPAIRAHLRFVAEALAATAGPAAREALEDLADEAADLLAGGDDEIGDDLALLQDAPAHELDLQFGSEQAGGDPSVLSMTERSLRVAAWSRYFLRRLGEALGDGEFAGATLAWMNDRQTQLANTLFAMDRRAKEAEIACRGRDAVDDPEVVNRIGQAAMLQAQTRFLVEAIAATLGRRDRSVP
jgi:hypothetical protein